MTIEAVTALTQGHCLCNVQTTAPEPAAPPSPVLALVGRVNEAQAHHAALLDALARRKIRTLPEAAAVSRVALALPPGDSHALLTRVAQFVVRMSEGGA